MRGRGRFFQEFRARGHSIAHAIEQRSDEILQVEHGSAHCTVFPEACSVSLKMQIAVNGAPRTVLWGSLLRSVAAHPQHLELLRLHRGRLTPVEVNPADPNDLRLPLLPGDRVNWE